MPLKDKQAHKDYNKKHRIIYHDYYSKYEEKRIKEFKNFIDNELKINGCSICGYNKNKSALQFHHVEPSLKKYKINHRCIGLKNLFIELDKCILLCANCHAEIHSIRGDI